MSRPKGIIEFGPPSPIIFPPDQGWSVAIYTGKQNSADQLLQTVRATGFPLAYVIHDFGTDAGLPLRLGVNKSHVLLIDPTNTNLPMADLIRRLRMYVSHLAIAIIGEQPRDTSRAHWALKADVVLERVDLGNPSKVAETMAALVRAAREHADSLYRSEMHNYEVRKEHSEGHVY